MSTIPFVEFFAKSVFKRAEVEAQRMRRLTIPGVISSVITEDPTEFILTTLTPGDADSAGAAPDRLPAIAVPRAPAAAATAAVTPAPAGAIMGLDSFEPVRLERLDAVSQLFGRKPAFWGRYVYATRQRNSSLVPDRGHYSNAENPVLSRAGVRVLLVARQTGRVGRHAAEAATDAKNNVDAILELFPVEQLAAKAAKPLVFLDCENDAGQPHLSVDYYTTWASEIVRNSKEASGGRVQMRPAVYGSRGDDITWAAVRTAVGHGAAFAGAWIAAWQEDPLPVAWSDKRTSPRGGLPGPVLAWQYSNRGPGCDTNIANPSQSLLDGLVQP